MARISDVFYWWSNVLLWFYFFVLVIKRSKTVLNKKFAINKDNNFQLLADEMINLNFLFSLLVLVLFLFFLSINNIFVSALLNITSGFQFPLSPKKNQTEIILCFGIVCSRDAKPVCAFDYKKFYYRTFLNNCLFEKSKCFLGGELFLG